MLQLHYQAFELEFEYPFTISKGTKTHQPTLVVGLGLRNIWGFGEAPAINYYGVTVPDMMATLEAKAAMISKYALTDPPRFWHFLEHLIPGQNFLIAALDIAGWDLFARLRRVPLYQLLNIKRDKVPLTDYTIGIDEPEVMVEKLKQHQAAAYKIKIRSAEDIDILRKLRAVTGKPLRIDANEALAFDDALRLLPEMQQLGVELVEQPLAKDAWEEMKELKAKSPLPLFADESCVGEKDVAKCKDAFHGINIKLTKCAGITPAMRMITEARTLGLQVMMGSMNESTIGTAAVAHLSPLLDYLDADGPLLLKEDVGSGLTYQDSTIQLSNAPGLGTTFWGKKRVK